MLGTVPWSLPIITVYYIFYIFIIYYFLSKFIFLIHIYWNYLVLILLYFYFKILILFLKLFYYLLLSLFTSLSQNGFKQAEELSKIFQQSPIDLIITSPLTRSLQTSLEIMKVIKILKRKILKFQKILFQNFFRIFLEFSREEKLIQLFFLKLQNIERKELLAIMEDNVLFYQKVIIGNYSNAL